MIDSYNVKKKKHKFEFPKEGKKKKKLGFNKLIYKGY